MSAVALLFLTTDLMKTLFLLMSENEREPLALENITYSDFMKLWENQNVLLTLTRSTSVHARKDAGTTFHYLVTVRMPCSWNALETTARTSLCDLSISEWCKHMLLMHDRCTFLFFVNFDKICNLNKCAWSAHQSHISGLHPRLKLSQCCCG